MNLFLNFCYMIYFCFLFQHVFKLALLWTLPAWNSGPCDVLVFLCVETSVCYLTLSFLFVGLRFAVCPQRQQWPCRSLTLHTLWKWWLAHRLAVELKALVTGSLSRQLVSLITLDKNSRMSFLLYLNTPTCFFNSHCSVHFWMKRMAPTLVNLTPPVNLVHITHCPL